MVHIEANKNTHIYIYFWIFGLINNVLYVVILSAAVDIVGPKLPKSLVLLADIVPSLSIKLTAPFFIEYIPYRTRIISLILVSCLGMFMVSLSNLTLCIIGIILASTSSGFGEITFLQLTHYYKGAALNGWSSGTGGAGLFGSGGYMLLTSIWKIPIKISLLLFSILPFGFLLYLKLVADHPINDRYEAILTNILRDENENNDGDLPSSNISIPENEDVMFLTHEAISPIYSFKDHVRKTLFKLKELVIPYMLPLTSVYLFEYLINQAISPTLLFPLDPTERNSSTPFLFHKYRDIYVTYGTLYQLGVFISRSTAHLFRLKRLYLLSFLQSLNFILAILQSWYFKIKNPWIIMSLIFYEGLLGGSSYINTFLNIHDEVEPSKTEFALGSVSIADSFGVFLAALIGLQLEPSLCRHQITDGRPWCQME
ncbi:amino acid transporter YHC3 NDAI_0G05770 [Naumovozyma dairenensis CBS 421]|uniref:Protein BTN n=1 Tax=Naumovozyma dairenensis (strain ATCC 10597 / BCRC 20456 / CBS 421 / NBRC 0211 / NRRL Y-12639) TaxID=1071378 RepID=J7SBT9_NAUDC|nr:hypothetical protein NDAI_0G05770 [Naumovozyma dairenensis CBS 421]CCK73560.1 hypothetical protein NDAI_0G05770 [Naumovozyma dairenensis CBS 421]